MEGKNEKNIIIILMGVIIIILVILCLLFATDTISFNSRVNSGEEQLSNNDELDNNQDEDDYNAESIAKEIMPTIISLANQKNGAYTYCGENTNSDLTKGNYYYRISTKFNNLNELKEYLTSIMIPDIYNKYFDTEVDKYIEKDNKLYCAYMGADGIFTNYSSESNINKLNNLSYSIFNKTINSFDATLSFIYSSKVDMVTNKEYKFNASFVKENSNWILKSYEELN